MAGHMESHVIIRRVVANGSIFNVGKFSMMKQLPLEKYFKENENVSFRNGKRKMKLSVDFFLCWTSFYTLQLRK